MSNYVGDFAPSSLVVVAFTTVAAATGAATALSAAPSAAVYKLAQTSGATAGVTVVANFASATGSNVISIDTSQDATFYAAGNDYAVALTSGSVGGTAILGYQVGHFSLNNRGIRANVIQVNGVAAATSSAQLGVNVVTFAGNPTGVTNIDRSTRSIALCTVSNTSTTTQINLSTTTPAMTTGSQFVGRIVNFDQNTTTANLRGQSTNITAGGTSGGGFLTVTALTDAPVLGDTFSVT